jgi:hypothetical protein
MSVVCCQVEVSATGWSLVQRIPTDCGVSKVCDRETLKKKTMKPRPPRGCRAIGKKNCYVTASILLVLAPFQVQMLTSALCSMLHPVYMSLLVPETKFHTDVKQQMMRYFCC